MLAGANGFITGGYLTTRGREVKDDLDFKDELRKFQ
jgi:biotin synthase